jgi:hypothetical protein
MELYLSLLPGPQREFLKRCALLDSFDGSIAGDLIPDGNVTLDDVVEYPFVYKVRGQPGAYRLREDVRRALMESWWNGQSPDAVPPELAAVVERLATRLEGSEADPAKMVGLRLFVDQHAALQDWRDLYAEADRRFDLLRCRSLIGLLTWPATVFPEVDAAHDRFQAYVDARSLWTDEWYRTNSFLLPGTSADAFESLLLGERGRMLELRGRGGYGKSSHLHWLIARRCVPAVPQIACARVDFDTVDPLAATRDPYLVLLEMADQLDQQLPGDAFGKLVRENIARRAQLYGRGRGRERVTAIHGRGFPELTADKDRSGTAADVMRRFGARLAEMPAGQPVVLILDTLEVPLHLPDSAGLPAIQPLLAALADIQRNAPGVRTVLVGRYHLSDALRDLFSDRLDPFELPKFTEEEARRYLAEKRGIQDEGRCAAAVQAADGVPFSLALLADLIDHDPEISTSTITSYRGTEYAYLVERVVKRIKEQPVRWVLRYAAIARRFDYEFVCAVVWPRVREVMSGARNLDDPAADDLPGDGESRVRLWVTGDEPAAADTEAPAAEMSVQQVWDQVKRYAGGSSWIRTDGADRNALRLQPEVVRPLRALLRGRDIVPALHADAVEYFIRRADEELAGSGQRDRAGEFLKEAVFHRFQLEGEAASGWWEEQIRTASDPRARYALAEELALGGDYTEPDGRPLPWGDGWLVAEQTLQRARLELCLASAELASIQPLPPDLSSPTSLTPSERDRFWQTATNALARLEAFPTSSLPPGRMALARAAVKLSSGTDEADVSEVRAVLEGPGTTPRERLWIAVLDASRLADMSSPGAAARLTEAKKLAEQVPGERDLRQMLAIAGIEHYALWDAYDKALAECIQAWKDGLGSSLLLLLEAIVRIESGDYASALSTAARLRATDRGAAGAATLIEAMSLRLQYRFAAAAESASRAKALAGTPDPSSLDAWVQGNALCVGGECAAAFLDIAAARKEFADALRIFEDAHDQEEAAGCHVREALLLIRELGQLRAAGVALDFASRAAPEGGDAALATLLLRTELDSRLEDPTGAGAALRAAELASKRTATPARLSAVAAAGLAFGARRDRDRYAAQLADNLSRVIPPVARLPLVRDIERGPLLGSRSAAAKRIREQVIPAGGWDHDLDQLAPLDRAALRLNAASLAIVLGDNAEAGRMLRTALREFRDGDESPAELRSILRLGRLLRAPEVVAEAGQAAVAAAMKMASDYPLLAAVTAIEHMEAASETGTAYWQDPAELCAQAEDLLSRGPPNAESWRGRLAELQAVLSQPDEPTRTSYLQTAADMYAAAGDVRKAEQVRMPRAGTQPSKDDPAAEVLVKLSGEAIKSNVVGWRLPVPRRGSAAHPVRTAVAEWVRSAPSTPYPPRLPDLMVDQWQGFTDALGELMCAADVRRRRRRLPADAMLSIRVYDGALQSLPWELASDLRGKMLASSFRRTYRAPARDMPSSRLIRFVQAGLNRAGYELRIDGVSGPDTVKALADWKPSSAASADSSYRPELVQQLHQTLLHGAAPRAVIVRAAAREGRRRSFALERRYARAGFEPYRVDDSHASALLATLNAQPPPVIVHVAGGLVAMRGAIGIDLLEGSWGSSPSQAAGLFTPTDLDRALRAVPPNWPSPVVVLDVPLPTGQREAADQLLLRNSFAADLFSLGGTPAVIGSGLAGLDNTRIVQDVLVEGFARGDAIGDILQQIRQTGPAGSFGHFGSAMAFAATALWTSYPGIRLPTARNA